MLAPPAAPDARRDAFTAGCTLLRTSVGKPDVPDPLYQKEHERCRQRPRPGIFGYHRASHAGPRAARPARRGMMADDNYEQDEIARADVSRRDFVAMSVAVGLAVAAGAGAETAADVVETDVTVKTPDGTCDAAF